MTRRILTPALLLSTAAAPVIAVQPDCQKWVAEYLARHGHERIAHSLRHVKHMLVKGRPSRHRIRHRRMSRAEALRRYLVDCGELDTPASVLGTLPPALPATPTDVPVATLEWPSYGPPVFGFPAPADVIEGGLPSVPNTGYGGGIYPVLPVGPGGGYGAVPLPPVSPVTTPVVATPEPATWIFVACGMLMLCYKVRGEGNS